MSLLRLLLLLGLAGLGWKYWFQPAAVASGASVATATAASRNAGGNGFVDLPATPEIPRRGVIIFAPENCSSEAAQQADALAADLAAQGIPYSRAHQVNFTFDNPDPAAVERLTAVMNGTVPIVFVHGRGKANPTTAEVLAEYRG
ncbi:MAG TPA: hypothetical protein VFK74_07030 [Azospira sp.]|nr:hypothetical protein [Azospira sp.]